jgi:hypothetical protein
MREFNATDTNQRNIIVLALGIITFICLALLSGPTLAAGKTEVREIIIEEARRTVVPPSLALAVAKVESGFQDDFEGKDGARGVMQIRPEVAEDQFGIDGEDLWDARKNVRLGLKILESLSERSDGNWDDALATYSTHAETRRSGRTKSSRQLKDSDVARDYVGDVLKWERRYADELIAQNEVEGRRREVLLGDASPYTSPSRHSSRSSARRGYRSRWYNDACADVDNDDQDVDAIHDCLETDEDGRFYTGDHKYRSPRYASRYASRYGKKHGKRYAWYRGPRHDLRGNIAERLRSARLYLDDFGDDFRPRRYRRGRGWRRR